MAATTFRCEGRRYPNAPAQAVLGCLGRVPPRVWIVRATLFTGQTAHFNGSWRVFWQGNFNQTPGTGVFTHGGAWQKEPPFPGNSGLLFVRTLQRNGVWTLRVEWRFNFIGLLPGSQLWYELPFSPGFPEQWQPGFWNLPHVGGVGAWLGGRPATQRIDVCTYGSLPANTCVV